MKCLVGIICVLLTSVSFAGSNFSFIALGDTAYKNEDYPKYHSLIDTINSINPAFTIHVGDTMGYPQLCSDEHYSKITNAFNRFRHPLIYTPGDNEWTDCYNDSISSDTEPDKYADYILGRLTAIRNLYFSNGNSLGKHPIALIRQSDIDKKFSTFSENSYWIHNNVLFATMHIVGSNDNFHPHIKQLTLESIQRRHAGFHWAMHLLKVAKKEKVKALVIAGHANLFGSEKATGKVAQYSGKRVRGGEHGPYGGYVYALASLTYNLEIPVLYIHGDSHEFVIDRPLLKSSNHEYSTLQLTNFTRVQVPAHPENKAVKISIDLNNSYPFNFTIIGD